MTHLGLIILIIISFEIIKFSKLIIRMQENINLYKKLIKLFTLKKVSDTWKEKALLNYSKNLFLSSLKIIVILIIIVIIFLIFSYMDENFNNLIFSLFGLIEITILFLIYAYLRKLYHARL